MARQKKENTSDAFVRDAVIENPILDNGFEKKDRISGNWIKATHEEVAEYEAAGMLIGYDPVNGEALIK